MELFRASQAKIEKHQSETLTIEVRDMEIRRVLAAEDKLHPALFSAEAEHKVFLFVFSSPNTCKVKLLFLDYFCLCRQC